MISVIGIRADCIGLSSDTKPEDAKNGDMFLEMDTGNLYAYDEENHEWIQQ